MTASLLIEQLRSEYKLTDKDLARVIPLFEELGAKKNKQLFQSGNIVRWVYFVEQGCLRQYYVNNNGEERTIYFKVEGGWASELVSFLDSKPTELNLQALEDCRLQVINRKNWMYAVSQIPSFCMGFIRAQQDTNHMLKSVLQKRLLKHLKRNICALSGKNRSYCSGCLCTRLPLTWL
ncbi:MAG: Crp/Fnr family transcriptional regulator [Bacteroidota bacterium]|nr:Crp/Fnr family transcriptional regulator [Bacteroidota bacterium]